jgi:hypothetical protein
MQFNNPTQQKMKSKNMTTLHLRKSMGRSPLMKMRAIVTPSLFLAFGLLLGTNAHAQDVKDTIKVAGANTESLTFNCGDIVVEVFSEEQTKPPPGWKGLWFSTPKWHRQAKATGSWASGSCSYSVKVVANSKFAVDLWAEM